jgi:hypothetical protein
MSLIKDILKYKDSGQTVFSLSQIGSLSPSYMGAKLNSAIKYVVKNGELIRISKGLYALGKNYSKAEFANKYRVPSYISFYTVLAGEGVVFQPYSSIYAASRRSEEKIIGGQKYIYRKIRDKILLNPIGIDMEGQVSRACIERAICDKIYLDGIEYFDNTRNVSFEKMKMINSEVYGDNQTISKWISQNTK